MQIHVKASPYHQEGNYPLKQSSFRDDCLDQLCLGAPDLKHCTSLWVRTFLFLFSVSYLLDSSLLSSSQPSDAPSVMKFRVIAVLTLMNQGLFITRALASSSNCSYGSVLFPSRSWTRVRLRAGQSLLIGCWFWLSGCRLL